MLFSTAISLSGCPQTTSPPLTQPVVSSNCAQNPTTKMYSCGIQFTVSSTSGNTQTSGVSVIVANPK
ncbi:MAG: hypothetical protein ACYDDE_06115 [bacterium]